MADIFSKRKRSWLMSRVRGTNTALEKKIFSYLRKERIYFQKHYRKAIDDLGVDEDDAVEIEESL